MTMWKSRILAVAFAALMTGAPAIADDIRPDSDARPMADEKCIEQCDVKSDECMMDAEGDSGKIQVCDDKYSECLQACEAR
jgi:hypothetical protein